MPANDNHIPAEHSLLNRVFAFFLPRSLPVEPAPSLNEYAFKPNCTEIFSVPDNDTQASEIFLFPIQNFAPGQHLRNTDDNLAYTSLRLTVTRLINKAHLSKADPQIYIDVVERFNKLARDIGKPELAL
jgi:hypothetical protein